MARISPAAERPTIRTVPDDLWQGFIVPTLSKHDPKPRTGRPRIDQRRACDGVLFILRTGCQWNRLPAEFGNDTAPGLRRASGTRPPPRVARARWSELARVLAPHAGDSTSRGVHFKNYRIVAGKAPAGQYVAVEEHDQELLVRYGGHVLRRIHSSSLAFNTLL